jgi:hypothetical protein
MRATHKSSVLFGLAFAVFVAANTCATKKKYPATRVPGKQRYRPPHQTAVQKTVRSGNVLGNVSWGQNAKSLHAAAEPWVRHYLETQVRPNIKNLWCANSTTDELLAILSWEFRNQPVVHNGPWHADEPGQVGDDTSLNTSLENGYLQNIVHRYLLGMETKDHFRAEQYLMTQYMNFPLFKNVEHPTMREANDRVVYHATNWQKANCGNLCYG